MIIFFVIMIISISDSLRNPKSPIPTQPKPTQHNVPTSTYFSNDNMDDTFGRWRVVVSCNTSRERERERETLKRFSVYFSICWRWRNSNRAMEGWTRIKTVIMYVCLVIVIDGSVNSINEYGAIK